MGFDKNSHAENDIFFADMDYEMHNVYEIPCSS